MRQEILDKHPSARLKVLVVWFDMLPGDGRQSVDRRLLGDPRVTNLWDERKAAGRWFAEQVPASRDQALEGISWDTYLVYGPDARWDGIPGPLIATGRPVIGDHERLRSSLEPFLRAG